MKDLIFGILFLSLVISCQDNKNKKSVLNSHFNNPIFAGDYPDPSILVDNDDYYVVHSSFEYYPGLTIWHSKDLVNWKPVKNTLKKYVGSVYAPDLIKYDNKYYIYFPANGTNYVILADAIDGDWSDPIDLEIGNIDPGHVVDDSGNRYLYFSNGGYVPLSKDGLTVTGELQPSYSGWPIPEAWSIECFCLEGPKLFKKGDYYYLTVAEGGTAGPATGHMVISARSKSALGPWENSPYNPIIRTENFNSRWCSLGHATIFEDKTNNWNMILHAYEKDHYNMGRQSLLAPIEWTEDGWFKLPDDFDIQGTPQMSSFSKNFSLSDHFDGNTLKPQWHFFKAFDENRVNIANNTLEIQAKGNSVAESLPLLVVPSNHSYTAQIEAIIEGDATAGFILFYDERAYSGILANSTDILANLRGWQFTTEENVIDKHVFLKIKNTNNIVDMFYSLDGEHWKKIESSLDVTAFHHNALNGFLSLRLGLASYGDGKVKFKNFIYENL
ncbi:family 43 glycosylhydrolase [Flaviramulus sp. BrNp1-15]|uniref:family 43 glycosylhydrolase n=1 Tax=Flaviramulus sp. BrNp1-15 TaxID=2916754 RepID=UPI001EE8AFAD|nr:family 43 glycosylhydrolase [Flaviramulus sp. BrNp1-15]ULC60211.1 family 43 glycosylhydrolase [Flaviramulus sp. BrNp1-15]